MLFYCGDAIYLYVNVGVGRAGVAIYLYICVVSSVLCIGYVTVSGGNKVD